MTRSGHRRSIPIFISLGILVVALTVALNIGWIVISWREGLLLALGVIVSLMVIAGVVLNTIFLVREIRRNEQQDSFLNSVTHELKTPVASIRLYLETLQSREVDAATRREFYETMLQDTERLQGTIEMVLRAGSVGSARNQRSPFRVDVADLASEALDLCRRRYHLGEAQLSLVNRCASQSQSEVLGDPDELQAAMVNLIDNAVKYSGKKIQVAVTVQAGESGRVLFRVTDEGVGISRSELGRIFKRFYRGHAVGGLRVKGTGLGLFIVRGVAKRHGGKVTAESEGIGRGSIFTLDLPRAPLRVAAPGTAGESSTPELEREINS
ncbi:MAG: HAMP domain-containing sensor histidine kinase [Bryobacterales bacterium]|nr:HAMP domain-containing sensor histidine kinase [Bryobacterales bacterium]